MTLQADGEFNAIPDIDVSAPVRFAMRQTTEKHLVEKPITLTVDGDYDDKIYFTGRENGRENWIQINHVYLYDIWGYFEELFDNPRMKEQFSAEELAQKKTELEADFISECPKGNRLLAVDYECEDNVSVEFHSKHWLDEAPQYKNRVFGILVKPEQYVGKLGMKLKTTIIQEPLAPDTKIIEAELFRYHVSTLKEDIVI